MKKQATERNESIRDSVRHTEVKVDRGEAGAPARSGAGYSGGERRISRQGHDGHERRASMR